MIFLSLFKFGDFLQIEPTTRCNLSCLTCTHRDGVSQIDITTETLQKILSMHKHIRCVNLQGLGEPFLHPQIGELFRIASERAKVTTFTNGTCVDFDVVDYLSSITVSLDTLDSDKAVYIKGKGYDLDRVIETLLALNSLIPTRINFVRSIHNLNEFQPIQKFCEVNRIKLLITPVENWYAPGESKYQQAHEEIRAARYIWGPIPRREPTCPWLHKNWYYYRADGERNTCCIRMHPDQHGNPRCCETCPD